MADATDTPQGQEPTNAGDSSGRGSIDSFPAEIQDHIRELRQENANRRTAEKDLRAKLQEFENANKTEAQRAEENLRAALSRAEANEGRLMRYEVAAEKNLPLHLADRLRGATKEELSADADKLAQDFGLATGGSNTGGSGFDGGVRRPVSRPKTMNELIRQRAQGR